VVVYSHAVVDPWAVMVELFYALVALVAVSAPNRLQDLAIRTEGGGIVLYQQSQEGVFIVALSLEVSRIHETEHCCKKQAGVKEALEDEARGLSHLPDFVDHLQGVKHQELHVSEHRDHQAEVEDEDLRGLLSLAEPEPDGEAFVVAYQVHSRR